MARSRLHGAKGACSNGLAGQSNTVTATVIQTHLPVPRRGRNIKTPAVQISLSYKLPRAVQEGTKWVFSEAKAWRSIHHLPPSIAAVDDPASCRGSRFSKT
jgi:hypothetical protein